jgi:hypothetical protein
MVPKEIEHEPIITTDAITINYIFHLMMRFCGIEHLTIVSNSRESNSEGDKYFGVRRYF